MTTPVARTSIKSDARYYTFCFDMTDTIDKNRPMDVLYRRAKLDHKAKERIARDYNAGMAVTAILAKYGIGRSTLYKVLRDVTNARLT